MCQSLFLINFNKFIKKETWKEHLFFIEHLWKLLLKRPCKRKTLLEERSHITWVMLQYFQCEQNLLINSMWTYIRSSSPGLFLRKGLWFNSPGLNGMLPFWEDSSCPPVSSWNLLFWDDLGLIVWYWLIFQVDHTFYKLDVKILAFSTKLVWH